MKYRFFTGLIIMAVLIGCAKPNIINQRFDSKKIVHSSQTKNIDNLSDYAVYLDKGDTIPLKISLDSEILDVAEDAINLVLKKKIYVRTEVPDALKNDNASSMSEAEKNKYIKKIKFFISPDAIRWAQINDPEFIEAVKQLFGIKGGSFAAGIGLSKEDGINAYLKAKINSIK